MFTSVGVLEDKSSSSRILEDNFEVFGLGLESRVLGLGLEACVLDSITAVSHSVYMKYRYNSMLVISASHL